MLSFLFVTDVGNAEQNEQLRRWRGLESIDVTILWWLRLAYARALTCFFSPPLSASILINLIESITFWQFLHRVFAYRIVDEVSQITLLGFLAWTVKLFRINLCMLEVVIDFLSRKSFIFCYSTPSKSTFFFFLPSPFKSKILWRVKVALIF